MRNRGRGPARGRAPGHGAGSRSRRRRRPPDRADLRLHGLPHQRRAARRPRPGLPPVRPPDQPPLLGPRPLRVGDRARARRRVAGDRRGAGAGAGLRRLPDRAPLQPSRRDGAGSGRHHQRAPRAPGVPRGGAAARRDGDHPDDLVRRRSGDPRRAPRRPPLPGVCHGDARRRPLQRRRGASGRAAEGGRIERAPCRRHGARRVRRDAGADARRELLARQDRLRRPPRRVEPHPDRAGRPLPRGRAGRARSLRPRVSRRDGPPQPGRATNDRRQPQPPPRDARVLSGGVVVHRAAARAAGGRRLPPLRESRHPVPHAPGFERLPAFDRTAWVAGVTYFPDPDVAVKVDYTVVRSRSAVVDAPNSLNVGLGWWF